MMLALMQADRRRGRTLPKIAAATVAGDIWREAQAAPQTLGPQAMAQPFAWDELARFAFAVLRPDAGRILAADAARIGHGAQCLWCAGAAARNAAELNSLMEQFPDEG